MHSVISVVWVGPVALLHALAVGIAPQSAEESPAVLQQVAAFVQAEQSAGMPAPPAPVDPAAPLAPAVPFEPAAPFVPAAPLVPPVPSSHVGTLAMQLLKAVQSDMPKQEMEAD
jgi:hypothetical protein